MGSFAGVGAGDCGVGGTLDIDRGGIGRGDWATGYGGRFGVCRVTGVTGCPCGCEVTTIGDRGWYGAG